MTDTTPPPLPPPPSARAPRHALRWQQPALALALSLAGSFAFTWGFVALGTAGHAALSGDFHEAETTLLLLAFPLFLPLFLWAFASPRQARVRTLLFGGAAAMAAAAWALQRALLT